jgi:hypothetical protein
VCTAGGAVHGQAVRANRQQRHRGGRRVGANIPAPGGCARRASQLHWDAISGAPSSALKLGSLGQEAGLFRLRELARALQFWGLWSAIGIVEWPWQLPWGEGMCNPRHAAATRGSTATGSGWGPLFPAVFLRLGGRDRTGTLDPSCPLGPRQVSDFPENNLDTGMFPLCCMLARTWPARTCFPCPGKRVRSVFPSKGTQAVMID